ncbi:MAG: peptidoglycan editing factor PgeF [Acidobacteriaceae bacterium]
MGKASSRNFKSETKAVRKKTSAKNDGEPDSPTSAEIAANLSDAGFQRERPLAAPYAMKQQRAKRDRERSTLPPSPGGVQILRSELLSQLPWLVHGFSTRQAGVTAEYGGNQMNLGVTKEDTRENVSRNREIFLRALGAESRGKAWPTVQMHQIHSAIIHRVSKAEPHPANGDGLITDEAGLVVGVRIADCIPVVAVDRKRRVLGVFHAGWRGTVQRIVQKGIGEMRRQFGCDPKDIFVAIGPGIGVCCYQVGDEVIEQFRSQFAYADELIEEVFDSHSLHAKYPLLFLNQRAPGHGEPPKVPHLNLMQANLIQAIDAGVPANNIDSLNLCTACRTDIFFSHRKEHITGRMMAAAAIKPNR